VAHTCLSNGIYQNNVFKTLLLDFMTYYQPITVSTEAITDFQENKQNKNQKKKILALILLVLALTYIYTTINP